MNPNANSSTPCHSTKKMSYLSHQLYNLRQIFLRLQNFLCFRTKWDKLGIEFLETQVSERPSQIEATATQAYLVEWFQGVGVFGVAVQPVDAREMFPLRQSFVQTPEHLYDTQGSRLKTKRQRASSRDEDVQHTGSAKSPPGGDTAPTMDTDPLREGEPKQITLPALVVQRQPKQKKIKKKKIRTSRRNWPNGRPNRRGILCRQASQRDDRRFP